MLEWIGEATRDGAVIERRFDVVHDAGAGSRVPGVLWTPAEAAGPVPLVLLGHGGAGHKRDDSRLDYAHSYVASGLAAAAIDGPFHGDRAPAEPGERAYDEPLVDSMVADWRATLDGLTALDEIDGDRVAYGGVSMGTMFGLPFLVADGRVRAAVLGLCGLRGDGEVDGGLYGRLAVDAPNLGCPVLFVMQWDDELFERDSVLALYDALGSADKRLVANPGGHAETPPHVRVTTHAFLVDALTAPPA